MMSMLLNASSGSRASEMLDITAADWCAPVAPVSLNCKVILPL